MSLERWTPVLGYEDFYEVSDLGRVRSLRCGRVMQTYRQSDGRPSVKLWRDRTRRAWCVPTLVLLSFIGPRPEGCEACHNDGDAANNLLINLRWDTRSANCYDRVRHGRDHKRNRTACPRRHLLKAPNLVASEARKGHRACLACSRAQAAGGRARRRGLPFDLQAESDMRYAIILATAGAG